MVGPTSLAHGAGGELRFRDKYLIRLINIGDREDEEGIKWSFELCQRDQQRVRRKPCYYYCQIVNITQIMPRCICLSVCVGMGWVRVRV